MVEEVRIYRFQGLRLWFKTRLISVVLVLVGFAGIYGVFRTFSGG